MNYCVIRKITGAVPARGFESSSTTNKGTPAATVTLVRGMPAHKRADGNYDLSQFAHLDQEIDIPEVQPVQVVAVTEEMAKSLKWYCRKCGKETQFNLDEALIVCDECTGE